MVWSRATYEEIKQEIRPGDVIAFGGKGGFAGVIKWATVGTVNHVAIVLGSDPPLEGEADTGSSLPQTQSIRIIEATSSLDKFPGVNIRQLEERMDSHQGEVWWLPLSEPIRQKLDLGKLDDFLRQQIGKKYDSVQALRSAPDDVEDVPLLRRLTWNEEDFTRFFCSELVAAGLEAGGGIEHLNCSEVTPMDLCRFAIYQVRYYQLKGDRRLIEGYNTYDPEGWGELDEPLSFRQLLNHYPALLGLIISCTLLLGLFVQELLLNRFAVIFGPLGSPRDLRLAIVHCLLAGYLPSACLYLLRGMRSTRDQLADILQPADAATSVGAGESGGPPGTVSARVLIIAGVLGLLLTVFMPMLTAETQAWDPSTWYPEVWWHRLLGLFMGWWYGWFLLAIWHTSTQTSRLAARIGRLDLLDLSPLSPFVKQGLLTSLLTVGAASLTSLFLLEPGQWPVVVISVGLTLPLAVLGLLLPVRGAHQRIRKVKRAELEWTRERIRRSRSSVYELSATRTPDVPPGQIADLCAYLKLVEDVSEWPFQASALVQVALYLLIPVVSWFCNLLIGNLLGHFFG
jgi:hypothetical protein